MGKDRFVSESCNVGRFLLSIRAGGWLDGGYSVSRRTVHGRPTPVARSEMTCSMEARVTTAPDRAPVRLNVAPPDPTLVGATEARKDVPTRPDARGAVADAPATAAVQRSIPIDVAIGQPR